MKNDDYKVDIVIVCVVGIFIYILDELLVFICSQMNLDTQQGACMMARLGILSRQPKGEGELQGNGLA